MAGERRKGEEGGRDGGRERGREGGREGGEKMAREEKLNFTARDEVR